MFPTLLIRRGGTGCRSCFVNCYYHRAADWWYYSGETLNGATLMKSALCFQVGFMCCFGSSKRAEMNRLFVECKTALQRFIGPTIIAWSAIP